METEKKSLWERLKAANPFPAYKEGLVALSEGRLIPAAGAYFRSVPGTLVLGSIVQQGSKVIGSGLQSYAMSVGLTAGKAESLNTLVRTVGTRFGQATLNYTKPALTIFDLGKATVVNAGKTAVAKAASGSVLGTAAVFAAMSLANHLIQEVIADRKVLSVFEAIRAYVDPKNLESHDLSQAKSWRYSLPQLFIGEPLAYVLSIPLKIQASMANKRANREGGKPNGQAK